MYLSLWVKKSEKQFLYSRTFGLFRAGTGSLEDQLRKSGAFIRFWNGEKYGWKLSK